MKIRLGKTRFLFERKGLVLVEMSFLVLVFLSSGLVLARRQNILSKDNRDGKGNTPAAVEGEHKNKSRTGNLAIKVPKNVSSGLGKNNLLKKKEEPQSGLSQGDNSSRGDKENSHRPKAGENGDHDNISLNAVKSSDGLRGEKGSRVSAAPTAIPTPTLASGGNLVSPTASLPRISPSPVTDSPTLTPSPAIEPTGEQSTPTETKGVSLSAKSAATSRADGELTITATEYDHGYWDFLINGDFRFLQPNRIYQLWLCGVNCSSHTSAKFMTDGSGNASISGAVINHAQINDPVSKINVWELPPQGEIIEDGTTCYNTSNSSEPCLGADLHF